VADEVFAKAKEKDVALIIRVPLASGLLANKFTKETKFASTDHRSFNSNGDAFNVGETFSGIEFSKGLELSKEISSLLPDSRLSQWALRWILDHPQVTTVIPGATKIEQVEKNMAASGLPSLDKPTHHKLRSLYDEKIRPIIRGHY
jgi:aryl-alcohol dehydrogenase-like predicted oxidoreductase